jgi:hypothetical protein
VAVPGGHDRPGRGRGGGHFKGHRRDLGNSQDLDAAARLAGSRYPDPAVLGKYLDFRTALAAWWVAEPVNWIRIEAVARALLERRTLSARECREVCRAALLDTQRLGKLFDQADD